MLHLGSRGNVEVLDELRSTGVKELRGADLDVAMAALRARGLVATS